MDTLKQQLLISDKIYDFVFRNGLKGIYCDGSFIYEKEMNSNLFSYKDGDICRFTRVEKVNVVLKKNMDDYDEGLLNKIDGCDYDIMSLEVRDE